MATGPDTHDASRRAFLRRVAAAACVVSAPAATAAAATPMASRALAFVHTHTGERLAVDYCRDGVYEHACLARVNRFLRDFRSGEVHAIDPRLLDFLYDLKALADYDTAFEVISGYRSPSTNAALRKRGSGVAVHSLHMEGRAIDVRLSGYSTRRLRQLALTLERGGVGFYAKSDFVHLDTGRVRTWTG